MSDCIFCKIARHEMDSNIVYETEDLICFRDIHPAAPVHVLIVPKKHYTDIVELSSDKTERDRVMGLILDAVLVIAEKEGIRTDGFRIVNNCGYNGGQTVPHLHFHLLGGAKLRENLD